MKGSYWFRAKSKKVLFEFSIRRNITVIKGDSATGKRTDIKESYHEFKEIYSNYPIIENNWIQNVVTEDSHSGYQFWSHAFIDSDVISSDGNGNLINQVKKLKSGDTLVIADGAAFGSLIESCISSFQSQTDRRISLWLPESFEYLILNSGIFKYYLYSLTLDGIAKYTKNTLNPFYLQDWVVDKIKCQLPEAIKKDNKLAGNIV